LWDNARITASDIDEEAVIVTEGNAVTNHLDTHITTLQSDGYQDERIRQNAPYDLILSNILANPLIAFAADLSKHLASHGYVVLSGFVDNQVEDVLAAHQKVGLKLIKLYQADNWRAALLQKE
jgi:ribosomal protein L11 methyltransferase